MKSKKLKILLWIAGILLAAGGIAFGIFLYKIKHAHTIDPLTKERLIAAGIDKADKVLILAHPDDDSLWAGGHLKSGNWFVLCITCGRNDIRREEFSSAMKASGNSYIILDYPDKVMGIRDDWEAIRPDLKKDLNLVLTYKDWKEVATHNPDGEYGHQHHKMASSIVTDLCRDLKMTDRLEYMGKYYKKSELPDVEKTLTRLTDEELAFKEHLLTFYKSQKKTVDKLSHMNPYEMWKPYSYYYEQ